MISQCNNLKIKHLYVESSWKIIMNLFFTWPVYYNKNVDSTLFR